jgi:hypothetical protein
MHAAGANNTHGIHFKHTHWVCGASGNMPAQQQRKLTFQPRVDFQ